MDIDKLAKEALERVIEHINIITQKHLDEMAKESSDASWATLAHKLIYC